MERVAATERGIEREIEREREIEMDKCGDDNNDNNDDGSIRPCAFLGLVMIPATRFLPAMMGSGAKV